jgi:hypothetical protein
MEEFRGCFDFATGGNRRQTERHRVYSNGRGAKEEDKHSAVKKSEKRKFETTSYIIDRMPVCKTDDNESI